MLSLLEKHNLFMKLKKCVWMQNGVTFLGHRLSQAILSVDAAEIRAVAEWPEPKCQRQLRSFLVLCSYYRKFVAGFSAITGLLHKLTLKFILYRRLPSK